MQNKKTISIINSRNDSYHHLRELRMGELIKRKLFDAFRVSKLDDTLFDHLSITEVKVSSGYTLAKVFISSLNLDTAKEKVTFLNSKKKQIRYALTRCIQLKYIPDLVFVIDDSFEKAHHIDELLSSRLVQQDLNN